MTYVEKCISAQLDRLDERSIELDHPPQKPLLSPVELIKVDFAGNPDHHPYTVMVTRYKNIRQLGIMQRVWRHLRVRSDEGRLSVISARKRVYLDEMAAARVISYGLPLVVFYEEL